MSIIRCQLTQHDLYKKRHILFITCRVPNIAGFLNAKLRYPCFGSFIKEKPWSFGHHKTSLTFQFLLGNLVIKYLLLFCNVNNLKDY